MWTERGAQRAHPGNQELAAPACGADNSDFSVCRAGSLGCGESGVTSSARHTRGGIEARTSSSCVPLSAANRPSAVTSLRRRARQRRSAAYRSESVVVDHRNARILGLRDYPTLLAGTGSPMATGMSSGEPRSISSWYGSTPVTRLRSTTSPEHQVAGTQRGPRPALQENDVGMARHGHDQGLCSRTRTRLSGGLSHRSSIRKAGHLLVGSCHWQPATSSG